MKARIFFVAWLLAMLPGLALAQSEIKPLRLIYEAQEAPRQLPNVPSQAGSSSPQVLPCRFRVNTVSDLRRNTTTLGASVFMFGHSGGTPLGGMSIVSGDAVEWINSAIKAHLGAGLDLPPPGGAGSPAGIDIGVRLAHVWTADLNMNAHVVIEVSNLGTRPPGAVARRHHGFATKLNWNNGDGEFVTTLNMALADAFKGLISGLAPICAQRP